MREKCRQEAWVGSGKEFECRGGTGSDQNSASPHSPGVGGGCSIAPSRQSLHIGVYVLRQGISAHLAVHMTGRVLKRAAGTHKLALPSSRELHVWCIPAFAAGHADGVQNRVLHGARLTLPLQHAHIHAVRRLAGEARSLDAGRVRGHQ